MSTRGLFGFLDGERVYGFYNKYDSYPSGLGVEMSYHYKDLYF